MATAHKSRVLDMTQGDPFRLVLQFSMPLFCSNLLQQLYNLTDTALAGHLLGSAALAEIGATAALYGLIMNFAFGMNNGLALTVSRYFGAGDESGIRRAVGWMVTLSAAVSLVLTGCSLLGRDALLTVLQVPAQAWGGASAYLTVILLGIPLTMLYNMEAALLRAVGNSVTPQRAERRAGRRVHGAAGAGRARRGHCHGAGAGHQRRAGRCVHPARLPGAALYAPAARGCHAPRRDQYVLGGP